MLTTSHRGLQRDLSAGVEFITTSSLLQGVSFLQTEEKCDVDLTSFYKFTSWL